MFSTVPSVNCSDTLTSRYNIVDNSVDWRVALTNSQYEQIIAQLYRVGKSLKSNQETKGDHEILHSLANIEEDIHNVILLLMPQDNIAPKSQCCTANTCIPSLKRAKSMPLVNSCCGQDSNFANKLSHLKTRIDRACNKCQAHHQHYKVNQSDIHFILGTSCTTHSKVALKQMKLASLKQHGPLCQKSCREEDLANLIKQINRQIQLMINEINHQHELISRRLKHHQQSKRQSNSMTAALSSHLMHLMNYVHDLHHLNQTFIRLLV